LGNLRSGKYSKIAKKAQDSLEISDSWLSRGIRGDRAVPCVVALNFFLDNKSIPLIDLIDSQKDLLEKIEELNSLNQSWVMLKRKHQKITEYTSLAEKKIKTWQQQFPEFDLKNNSKRLEQIVKVNSNWPLVEMYDNLNEREASLFFMLEETRKKILDTLEKRLQERVITRDKTISLIHNRRYYENLKPLEAA